VRLATLTSTPDLPSLVEAVSGERIRGSWWGHPAGGAIFAAASALEASGEALATKLVDGKVTFVHRSLWPPLLRVVTDPAIARPPLDAAAKELLSRVRAEGRLRLDQVPGDPKIARKAAKALEAGLHVLSQQEHTERGKHETMLRSWEDWAPAAVAEQAQRLDLEAAFGELNRNAAGRLGVLRRW
jgi:hypothetical protein